MGELTTPYRENTEHRKDFTLLGQAVEVGHAHTHGGFPYTGFRMQPARDKN